MRLHRRQLPCPKPQFLTKLAQYQAAREAHKSTVGVAAPFPEFEILRTIYERGGSVTIDEESIVSARYVDAGQTKCAVTVQGESAELLCAADPAEKLDPYLWALVQEWAQQPGHTITAYVAPVPPTPEELEAQAVAALNGGGGFDMRKLFKAKFISDLAFRLGKAPGALTGAEITAERNRIAAIYKAL